MTNIPVTAAHISAMVADSSQTLLQTLGSRIKEPQPDADPRRSRGIKKDVFLGKSWGRRCKGWRHGAKKKKNEAGDLLHMSLILLLQDGIKIQNSGSAALRIARVSLGPSASSPAKWPFRPISLVGRRMNSRRPGLRNMRCPPTRDSNIIPLNQLSDHSKLVVQIRGLVLGQRTRGELLLLCAAGVVVILLEAKVGARALLIRCELQLGAIAAGDRSHQGLRYDRAFTADDYHVYSPMSSWTNSGIMMIYSGDFGDLRCIQ